MGVKAVTIESIRGRGEVEVARGRVKKGGTDRGWVRLSGKGK